MNKPIKDEDNLISIREVKRLTSLSKSVIYDLMAQGKFPKRIKLTKGRVAWKEVDVRQWIRQKITENRTGRWTP